MPGPRILQWIIVRYNALCLPVQVPEGYNWLGYFSRFADGPFRFACDLVFTQAHCVLRPRNHHNLPLALELKDLIPLVFLGCPIPEQAVLLQNNWLILVVIWYQILLMSAAIPVLAQHDDWDGR